MMRSFNLTSIDLNVLGYRIKPSLDQIPWNSQIIIGNDVNAADFGTLISCNCVLTKKFHTNITDDDGETRCKDTNKRINVKLDDNPCKNASYAHETDKNDRLCPMMNVETFFPVKSEEKYFVKRKFRELITAYLLVRRISYGVEHTRHLRSADSSSLKLSTSQRRRHSWWTLETCKIFFLKLSLIFYFKLTSPVHRQGWISGSGLSWS